VAKLPEVLYLQSPQGDTAVTRRKVLHEWRAWVVASLIVVATLGGVSLSVFYALDQIRRPTLEKWQAVQVGVSEERVRELLGPPRYEYDAVTAPEAYYVPGFGRKERTITGKVFIYFGGGDLVLYVYVSPEGRVEETVSAGT